MRPPAPESPLILGSASPRRRELLEQLHVPFVVHAADVDERVLSNESPDDYLVRIVRTKLAAVRGCLSVELRQRASLILVADTTVLASSLGGTVAILGKPADRDEARRMVERLSGTTHEVRTRFALGDVVALEPLHEETVVTRVTFRAVAVDEATAYAASGEGMDKAGGYAAQGAASAFVSRIDGSYSNVVGLPTCELSLALRKLGGSPGRAR
jgi:septum formation protein